MKLADRLRAALGPPLPDALTGDADWPRDAPAARAAVLVAVTDRGNPGVILTVRRDDLRTHAGQVAFPGGRIEPGESAPDAAVREAWEELSIERNRVETVAELGRYRTITGFDVTPVLAAVPADLVLVPHDREVADWFEAPLAFLLDPANQRRQSVLFEGRTRHYYEIEWEGRRIWGATAAMLVNLSRRLAWG
jgi:8-oxo-dGTP pyrophosphatase MutT (NUDIX family)